MPERCWQIVICLMALTWGRASAASPAAYDELGINQLQVIGTHNSYHTRAPAVAKRVREWNYNHAPLDVQLDRGVRSFELDLHYKSGDFEVFHVPILDEGTTCRCLSDALATVRKWSDSHPRHIPISFLFEFKKEGPRLDKNVQQINIAALDHLDEILASGFPRERRLTPDDVRSGAGTLREAVTTRGWPAVSACRGKVFFILHDNNLQRDLYTREHPSLRGRQMFVRSDESRDDGAVLVLDNPRAPEIPGLVRAGFFIRTRADSDLATNLERAVVRRDAALASGAQIVSTDFPSGEPHAENGYTVHFSQDAPARVNPVSGPEMARGSLVGE